MKKVIIALTLLLSLNIAAVSQEFIGNVQVQTQGVDGIDPSVFSNLETTIFEFMNNRVWSSYSFQIEERIGFTIVITIKEVIGSDIFSGQMNIVLERPAYGADYNSVVINLVDDDIKFEFVPHQSMDYSDGSYTTNLTSILAYYAYLMLGLDFDTYSLEGGTAFYEKAMDVATSAQSSSEKGWQAYEGPKNRYQLIENLLNPSYSDMRKLLYEYHRQGIDVMASDKINGRANIGKSLKYYKNVYNKRSGLYLLQVLTEAKRSEIISIFTEGTPAEKNTMLNIMKEVDPANSSRYEAVNK